MASASKDLTLNEPSSKSLGSDLKKRASFTLVLIFQLVLDGVAVLVILLILDLLDKAINVMGLPDGNILQRILQYSHLIILVIYLMFVIISVYGFLRERMKDGNAKPKSKPRRKTKPKGEPKGEPKGK